MYMCIYIYIYIYIATLARALGCVASRSVPKNTRSAMPLAMGTLS